MSKRDSAFSSSSISLPVDANGTYRDKKPYQALREGSSSTLPLVPAKEGQTQLSPADQLTSSDAVDPPRRLLSLYRSYSGTDVPHEVSRYFGQTGKRESERARDRHRDCRGKFLGHRGKWSAYPAASRRTLIWTPEPGGAFHMVHRPSASCARVCIGLHSTSQVKSRCAHFPVRNVRRVAEPLLVDKEARPERTIPYR